MARVLVGLTGLFAGVQMLTAEPVVITHVPQADGPLHFDSADFVDIAGTERMVTVPAGTAVIAWTVTGSIFNARIRPAIGSNMQTEGVLFPQHNGTVSGSWATTTTGGTFPVRLQVAGSDALTYDPSIGTSWTLIVFPIEPPSGISCWDLNEDRHADPATEDLNNDGDVDVLDCRGTDGNAGQDGLDGRDGVDGLSCWDQDGDGHEDPEEDINGDGQYSALDCQGQPGPPVRTSAVCFSGTATCADTCGGANRVVAQAEAPCRVTSDTGACSWRRERNPARCCVCAP